MHILYCILFIIMRTETHLAKQILKHFRNIFRNISFHIDCTFTVFLNENDIHYSTCFSKHLTSALPRGSWGNMRLGKIARLGQIISGE